jgi:hypothetical protein
MQIALTFRGNAEFMEEAVLEMYRTSEEELVKQIKGNEDLALFIVDHKRLAELFEGLPGNNYYLAHHAVRHPNVALHVLCNHPELHSMHSSLGATGQLRNIALSSLKAPEKSMYYAFVDKGLIRR